MSRQHLIHLQSSNKVHLQNADLKMSAAGTAKKVHDSQILTASGKQINFQRQLSVQQQHESEQMGTLHARLHQEADKIRKWKIQTELDLKEKEKKLSEASSQIETLKKSLLESQLQNEKTSTRLQDELGYREDILQRINGTREMCNLLQALASKMEDRLTKCETERTELKYVGKENLQHIEEITMQLQDLQLAATESKKKIQSQANIDNCDRLQKEEAMRSRMDATASEIEKLQGLLEEKDRMILDLQSSLHEDECKLKGMKETVDEMQKKDASLSEELLAREEELKESSLRISNIQDDKNRLEKKVKGLEKEFNSLQMSKDSIVLDMTESRRRLEEELQNALQEAEKTKTELEEEKDGRKACEASLADAKANADNFKNSRDILMLEKTDLEMHLNAHKFQLNNLMSERDEDKEEIKKLNIEIGILNTKLERENNGKLQAQYDVEALQGKLSALELEHTDLREYTVKLKNDCFNKQNKIESLENLLSEEENKTIKLQSTLDTMEQKVTKEREHVREAQDRVSELKQDVNMKDEVINQKNEEIEKLEQKLKDLQLVNRRLEDKLNSSLHELEYFRFGLNEKDSKVKELTAELSNLSMQRAETGKSLTSQQRKMAATLKENEDLEREVKNLKEKLDTESQMLQECKKELNSCKDELIKLEKVKQDAENSLKMFRENMKRVKQQCELDQEAAKLEQKKAEEMQADAEKEKQNALARTDFQLTEMMATLEAYKQNNEKLLTGKDSEIQALQKKIESSESQANLVLEQKKQIEKLQKQVAVITSEKEKLTRRIQDKTDESKELVDKIKLGSQQTSITRPVTPQRQISRTPSLVTPKPNTLKTPQCSILRVCNSEPKRRKVSIVSSNDNPPSSSEESDLMELDTAMSTSVKAYTPLLVKRTPKQESRDNVGAITPKSTISRIPVSKLPTSVKQLDDKTSNVRKAPVKKTNKVFTLSPRSRTPGSKTRIKEKTKSENSQQMAWFELDSVYGFGPED